MLAWMFRSMGALAPAVLMAACNSAASTSQQATAATDVQVVRSKAAPRNRCDADTVQSLIGQPFGDTTLQQALEAAGADSARMLRPDTIITKEYAKGRLNVMVGDDGVIVRVYCG